MSWFNRFNFTIHWSKINVACIFIPWLNRPILSFPIFKNFGFSKSRTEQPSRFLLLQPHWLRSCGHWGLKWAIAYLFWGCVHVIRRQFFKSLKLFNGARVVQSLFLLPCICFWDWQLRFLILCTLFFLEVPSQSWILVIFRLLSWRRRGKSNSIDRGFTPLYRFHRTAIQPWGSSIRIIYVLSSESQHYINFYLLF